MSETRTKTRAAARKAVAMDEQMAAPAEVPAVVPAPVTLEVPPAAEMVFLEVLKRQLHPSPTNPRQLFAEGSLAEMEASVRKHGVIQPLIVRRWPEKDRAGEEAYEIVCGERRFRGASRVEGLERLPVMVRPMTDTEVREIQIIENLQREDVSPYDEAVGYAALLELRGPEGEALYSVERIAEKIGKAVSYVRNRLKIQRTPKALLEALRRGEVGARVCEIVGRIPHEEDRERCAEEILRPLRDEHPLTVSEVMELVHGSYMVRLKEAPFDRGAADLLPGVGSCEGCRFRSGMDPDLVEDLATGVQGGSGGRKAGIDPQLCLSPRCFREKCAAHVRAVREASPELVLSEAEAKAVFDEWGNVRWSAKLKPAGKKPDYDDVGHYDTGKLRTWAEYAKRLGVPVRLAVVPKSGQVVQLVDRAAVKAAERAAAPEKPVFEHAKGGGSGAEKKYREEERRRAELSAEEVRIAFDRLRGNLVGQVGREELLAILEMSMDHQGIDVLMRWMEIKASPPKDRGTRVVSARAHKIEAVVGALRAGGDRYDREAILILILLALFAEGVSYNGLGSARFREFALARGVDYKEVRAAAKAAVKERRAAKKAGKTKGKEQRGKGAEGKGCGAPEVNHAGVIVGSETVVLASEKNYAAEASVGEHGGRWFAGWVFDGPGHHSSSWPAINREVFNDRAAAVRYVCETALAYFSRHNGSSPPAPKGFIAKLQAALDVWGAAAVVAADSVSAEPRPELLDALVERAVRGLAKVGGSVVVTWSRIGVALGLEDNEESGKLAMKVESEMRKRRMVSKGVLNLGAASVKAILAAEEKGGGEV